MGPLDQLIEMIPGINKLPIKGLQADEEQLKYAKAVVQSMTPEERRNPSLLNHSRRLRIARGSGTAVSRVNQLVQQLGFMNRMIKQHAMVDMPQLPKRRIAKRPKSMRKRKRRKRR
jgi:signal recognition particle subunit SRP54